MFNFFLKSSLQTSIKQKISEITVDTCGVESLYDYIEQHSGISLQKSKVLVKNNIVALCKENNISSFGELLVKIKNNEILYQALIDSVTVHETYFFREKEQLERALKKYRDKEPLCILSLPCSSGEEVYSIVIIALEMGIKDFKVIGVDISNTIIQKATKSFYTKRDIDFLPEVLLKKYFLKEKDGYRVKNELKSYVKFFKHNLFEDTICHIGKFDIIFSRNMFIYFNDEKKIKAYKRLEYLKKEINSSISLGHADASSRLSEYIRSQN